MEQNQVCVLFWVKFTFNYPDIKEVIKWICEKTDKNWLYDHLLSKFYHLYDTFGSHAVMGMFYCEIDKDLRDALTEYALTVWAPVGMCHTYEEVKGLLGIK